MKTIGVKILMPVTLSFDVSDEIASLIKMPWHLLSAEGKEKIGSFIATLPHHAEIVHFEIDGTFYQ